MNNKATSDKKIIARIGWYLALFVNILLTVQAILTHNTPGCIAVILFGIYIAKFGDPIIFEKYNSKREKQYQKAYKKRERYRAMKEKSKVE